MEIYHQRSKWFNPYWECLLQVKIGPALRPTTAILYEPIFLEFPAEFFSIFPRITNGKLLAASFDFLNLTGRQVWFLSKEDENSDANASQPKRFYYNPLVLQRVLNKIPGYPACGYPTRTRILEIWHYPYPTRTRLPIPGGTRKLRK